MKLRKGYDRIYRPTRYFRQRLSYEEVQRRLDLHYGGKLTIVEYNGHRKQGTLTCKECGTFTTKNIISGYINTNGTARLDCELCHKREMIAHYNSKLSVEGLEVIDYYTKKINNKRREQRVVTRCDICGNIRDYSIQHLGDVKYCEHCRELEYENTLKDLLLGSGLRYISNERVGANVYMSYECKTCGYNGRGALGYDEFGDYKFLGECPSCKETKNTEKYRESVRKYDCTYIGRYVENKNIYLSFRCNNCGVVDSKQVGHIKSAINICSNCSDTNSKAIISKSRKVYQESCRTNGRILKHYNGTLDAKFVHLFCNHTGNIRNLEQSNKLGCARCFRRLTHGKPKEHNKHLVDEYLIILYNVQKLKNFFVEHEQLQNVPDKPRSILEHIDGWINNYESIKNKYPNGDLGTMLEGNPLYEECRKVFYPIMDKYGIDKIETLGGN